jgi:nitrate reductase delta subunit
MGIYQQLAEALQYPYQDQFINLQKNLDQSVNGSVKKSLTKFIQKMQDLSLSEREELYTRTLDLNPLAVPYVGYHAWGESYKRGAFMSGLNKMMDQLGINKDGELPDHLVPILRYLEVSSSPIHELNEVFLKSIKTMRKDLKSLESDNPYNDLLAAIESAYKSSKSDLET